jgi:hypothetical protein
MIRKLLCALFGHKWDYWGNVCVQERKRKRCDRHDIKFGNGAFVRQIPVKRRMKP